MKAANLAVRFLLELCALAALAVWGWQVPDQIVVSVLLAIAAPLVAATVWGLWVAPKAGHRLDDRPDSASSCWSSAPLWLAYLRPVTRAAPRRWPSRTPSTSRSASRGTSAPTEP